MSLISNHVIHVKSSNVIHGMCHWDFPEQSSKKSAVEGRGVKYVFPGLWRQLCCQPVISSHYDTMEAINCDRSHIAARPVYAILELLFARACNQILLLSCRLHNCQRIRLVRNITTRTSVRNLVGIGPSPYYTCHSDLVLVREIVGSIRVT
jgi:hypothetical protein